VIGEVCFHVRTYAGIRSALAQEAKLGAGTHSLSPLFFAAHSVIAAARERAEEA
jgi:hypothetical protein